MINSTLFTTETRRHRENRHRKGRTNQTLESFIQILIFSVSQPAPSAYECIARMQGVTPYKRLFFLQFLPVRQKFLDPDVRERVLHELVDDAERYRGDVRAGQGRVHHVERVPDARYDHFGVITVITKDRHDLAQDRKSVV